jgi:alpha-N-acetylglucosaminidase
MNVCTHSYSLVWYSWNDWSTFLDWMSLSGINLFLAMTGQEEVQYKVFQKLGLSDMQIRSWFNGPALLTWSRGQNEYGSNIAGPLPRSWMKGQWKLQKNILAR